MSYDPVQVTNSTQYDATGTVTYVSLFCSDDDYGVPSRGTWKGPDRGVCLVKEVSATLDTPFGQIPADPYTSSGTIYSLFAIIALDDDHFQVTAGP